MSEPVIGIDLGTTNSVAAVTNHAGITDTIAGPDGARIVASVVHFPEDGGPPLVGEGAKQYSIVRPERTASLFKRGMGSRTFSDDGKPFIVDGEEWPPEKLSSLVLMKLADNASHHLGQKVTKVVITVPAYFAEAERAATKTAGEMAGLEVVRVVNEPTAAAIAHGVEQATDAGRILVFDLGGGTFDVTVMNRGHDGALEVLYSGGSRELGGSDFDKLIIDAMAAQAAKEVGVDIRSESWMLADAAARAEEMKKELSKMDSSTRPLSTGGRPVMFTLTRAELEGLIGSTLQDVEDTVISTVENAGLALADIDSVLMVGGSSRMPVFQALLERLTGKEPKFSRNLDEDVARGAAILAAKSVEGALDARSELALMPAPVDAASHGLGITVLNRKTGKTINQVMIAAGTPVPAQAEETFETGRADQSDVRVELNEGDSEDPDFVRSLGETIGRFASSVPEGHPVVVVMEYTIDQMVKVSAKDGKTGDHLCDLVVEHKGSMSAEEQSRARQMLSTVTVR